MKSLSEEQKKAQADLFEELADGDKEAITVMYQLVEIADTWDNLIDQDLVVDPKEVFRAFWHALIDLQLNSFYRRYSDLLTPVLASSIMAWVVANEFEKTGEAEKVVRAHTLRYMPLNVLMAIGLIKNGPTKMATLGVKLWSVGQPDTLEEYSKEIKEKYANVH